MSANSMHLHASFRSTPVQTAREKNLAARRDMLLLCAVLSLYAIAGLLLLTKLSLWLDEIIDLHLIRDFSLRAQIIRIPMNAGGVPLSYFIRDVFCSLLGYSKFAGRLPSLLFSMLAAVGVYTLARQMKLRFPVLATVLFCLMPLQFRYALESRPYSLALAITIWATVVFWEQIQAPRLHLAGLYGALAILGLYAQPFTIFVFVAHFLWTCCAPGVAKRSRLIWFTGLPIACAALCFLPWELAVLHMWDRTAAARGLYAVDFRTLSVLLHELTGAGYLGSAVVVALCAFAILRGVGRRSEQAFWALYILVPIALALAADKLFGYFFATRQVIPILAPLALLMALSLEILWEKKRGAALTVLSLVVVTLIAANIGFFRRPRENWQAAALILRAQAATGKCILVHPASDLELYEFFVPDLAVFRCIDSNLLSSSVLLAINPYRVQEAAEEEKRLRAEGFTQRASWNPRMPEILWFTREAHR